MAPTPLPLIPWSKTHLLEKRGAGEATRPVLLTVIDLFVLGYADQANKLIASLWEHSHGLEYDRYNFGTPVMAILYHAWKSTGTIPALIKNPELDKIFAKCPDTDGFKENNHWKSAKEGWLLNLPKSMKGRAKDGHLEAEDVEISTKEIWKGSCGSSRESDALSICTVVEIVTLAGQKDVARNIVNKDVLEVYREILEIWNDAKFDAREIREWQDDRLGLKNQPAIWEYLKDATFGKSLNVDQPSLDAFVSEGCDLIKQRFTKGPSRPFAGKSISQLVQIMNENYVATGAHQNWGELPETFLHPPASEPEIKMLEKLLSRIEPFADASDSEDDGIGRSLLPDGQLPDDFKEFLRVTNGFYSNESGSDSLLYDIPEIITDDLDYLHDYDYTLFPYDYTTLDDDMDNVSLGTFDCFSVGAGGDEGVVALIPPLSVRPMLAAFETAYAEASEKNKRLYERAALDLYGGLDAVRKIEWLVLVSYHWDPTQYIYGSFREYLEHCTSEAIRRREDAEKTAEKKQQAEAMDNSDEGRGEKRKSVDGSDEESDSQEHKSQRTS